MNLEEAQKHLDAFPKLTPERLTALFQQVIKIQDEPGHSGLMEILEIGVEIGGSFWHCSFDEKKELEKVLAESIIHLTKIPLIFAFGGLSACLKGNLDASEAGAVALSYELFPEPNEDLID